MPHILYEIIKMSDPQKNEDKSPPHHHAQHIDDPALFLSLDSPHVSIDEARDAQQVRSELLSNDEEYVPEAIDEEEENKNEDIDLYEPQSLNLQELEEEDEKSLPKDAIQKPIPIAQAHKHSEEDKTSKVPPKKKKKGRKKGNDSQEDQYSGEYMVRKKSRGRDSKKASKRNEAARSRGKPRGRGANASKLSQVKKQYVFPEDVIPEKGMERRGNASKKPEVPPQPVAYITAPFNSNWRIAQENQQDWDSQNASIGTESVNKRADYAAEIANLINEKPENIISLIANLPLLHYNTFN